MFENTLGRDDMTYVSSFEILAENLVPTAIIPSGPQNPFLIQGFFVEVSCLAQSARFNLIFQETTDFKQGLGPKALFAQIIDSAGNVNPYNNFFASTGRGFLNMGIASGQTLIFGVQCLPQLVGADEDESLLPQGGTGWRGTVRLDGPPSGAIIATPTQRLVYYTGPNPKTDSIITASVYGVPTASGGTLL